LSAVAIKYAVKRWWKYDSAPLILFPLPLLIFWQVTRNAENMLVKQSGQKRGNKMVP
jgi:hypothetical protein